MGVVDRVSADFSAQVGSTPTLGKGVAGHPDTLDIVMNGRDDVVVTPYRQAVSLLSRRLARMADETAGAESETSQGPAPVETPAGQEATLETPIASAQPAPGLEPPYDQEGYTAVLLVAELERRGLSTKAKNKAELIARLEEDDLIGLPGSTPQGDAADMTGDEPSTSDS